MFVIPKKIAKQGYEISMRYFCDNLELKGELDTETEPMRRIYIGDKCIRLLSILNGENGEVIIQEYSISDDEN